MMWVPGDILADCNLYPTLPTCHPSVFAFMTFLLQNFGHSYDGLFTDSKINDDIESQEFDFIVVGTGAAGCVVANRLTEIDDWKVLLLEAGGEEPLVADVPGLYTSLLGSSIDWNLKSLPEPVACRNSKDHRCYIPRGKGMGGSSLLNGFIDVRGNRDDFDRWASLGNEGWSYDEVLPYFLKSEDYRMQSASIEDSKFHSRGGYLRIDEFPYNDVNSNVIVKAWEEIGLKLVDYNGLEQVGVGYSQNLIINGARQSSNAAFIEPIRGRRKNLIIRPNTLVTRVLIDPDTKRAVGIEYTDTKDEERITRKVYATKEVILSAGAVESPKLLMLSGIGHEDELEKAGIDLIVDLPVGDNLQNHVMVPTSVGILSRNTSTVVSAGDMQNDAAYWLSTHDGPLSSVGGIQDGTAFIETAFRSPDVPDIQVLSSATLIKNVEVTGEYNLRPSFIPVAYYDAVVLQPMLLRGKNRGTVRLNSTDPTWSHPLIQLNLLTHPSDVKTIVKSALKTKKLFNTEAFKRHGIKEYTKPPKACANLKFNSASYFTCIVRNYAVSGFHLAGSCKMGPRDDVTAVVDPRLRVYGVKGLRVVDSSVMPTLTKGTIYAPVVMIGEKGSDLIKDDWLN